MYTHTTRIWRTMIHLSFRALAPVSLLPFHPELLDLAAWWDPDDPWESRNMIDKCKIVIREMG